ncbi:MAG: amino acid racemase [Oscillospiraceae bacterium]|nr:amino acid racemase [Oscillospiraceae bacterium]
MKTPLIGVIGGMGTSATAAFYEKLHSIQDVAKEQEYVDVLLYSKPSIPDRTAFILGKSKESPTRALLEAAKSLEVARVTVIAMPCISSYSFYDELTREVRTKIINLPGEVAKYTKSEGIKEVGLLATEGTIKTGVLQSKFEAEGIKTVALESKTQAKLTKIIYGIKKGGKPQGKLPTEITDELMNKGVEKIVLGCTELCFGSFEDESYINVLDILATATLRECLMGRH